MKNIIIGVLILAVAALGFVLFTQNNSTSDNFSSSNGTTTTMPATSGKTIDLANQGLREVPKNVLDDKTATTLNVSGNNLTGSLPGEIRKLTNLQVLDASNNDMTGIPAEIGQLSKLRVANFANNKLSGLPLEIGNLRSLETLDLRGNPNVSKNDLSKIQAKIPNAKILTD